MLKLKRFDKGVWCDVPGLDGVKVKVRPASHKKIAEIMSAHKRKIDTGKELIDEVDEAGFALDLFRYILEDFDGIECEEELSKDEMKDIIYDYDDLREFISQKSGELREKIQKELEEDLKNLRSSQSG